jgi:hypothetical protein
MDESDDIIEQNPILALLLIVVIGAGAYAGISFVMRQTVNPVEVGVFAVIFAVVYVVFAFYSDTIEGYLGTE